MIPPEPKDFIDGLTRKEVAEFFPELPPPGPPMWQVWAALLGCMVALAITGWAVWRLVS